MLKVPESVLAYHQQPSVRAAVDLLLSKQRPAIPEDLGWGEMQSFYRACLAARQTQFEHAMLLEEMWRAVWPIPDRAWTPLPPHKPGRSDLSPDPANIWEDSFGRRFVQPSLALELAVSLNDVTGFQLGIGMWRGKNDEENLLETEAPDGWASEHGYDFIWTQHQIVPLSEDISLEPFKRWTEEAMGLVSRLTKSL
ncbi:hypothetical protein [Sphingomonas sp.]|uniref:hypothetical protein n=1 Tax=Sphingomonas sp. TaxID=28214 RepID=UPI003F6EA0A3